MSYKPIKKQEEYIEYPKYDDISFFLGSILAPVGIENQKQFYNEFIDLLMEIGVPFDKKSFIKYMEIYKKSKMDKSVADKKFKEYIYGDY
jgi:hypothetical protein